MISDIVLSGVLIALSLIWACIGIFDLGLWIPGVSADSGFVPTAFSLLTLACAIIMLLQSVKKYKKQYTEPKEERKLVKFQEKIITFLEKHAAVFFCILGIVCLQYLGLIPATLIVMLSWLKLINGFSWSKSVMISVVVTATISLIFDLWLQIPFPGLI